MKAQRLYPAAARCIVLNRRSYFNQLIQMLILSVAMAGCTSLPDVSPFVDSTHELKSAVAQSGTTVAEELRYLDEGESRHADQLEEAWKNAENSTYKLSA